jgi:DNA mismatch repair protein MutS2
LVISGPNAGGKSVCLKTVGILQFMLQCGLLVPVDAHSEMGVFNNIFIDIGDQQSIENDLSTYSSHIKNMSDLLNNASDKTLFLCDELGSGTEPQIGGAIAEAIVEELVKKGSYGIITTHYANLKLLPDRTPHIVNAAMLFDTDSHKPLYILQIGNPGSSFAMEMARNIGLPENILKNAEKKVGTKYLDFEIQLQEIEVEKKILAKKEEEIAIADEFLKSVIEKYQKSTEKINKEREKILAEAKNDAKKILSETNKLIENTISNIKTANAEKEKTKEIREKFEAEREKITHIPKNKAQKNLPISISLPDEEDFATKLKNLKKRFSGE